MQQEDETAGRQKDVQDQSQRRYSREEIAATIPDEDHEYPLRLEYFITFNATPAPSAAAGFLATVHRGRDRPERLAVWKQTGENSYQQLLVRESGTSALEKFDVPKVFFPKGQVPGLGVQFLDLREHVSNGWRVEDSLYAVDGDDLRPVQIESPEEWYKSKLQPGESIMNGFANSFSDYAQPAFAFTIWKKGDAQFPTGGQVTGTYRIVREERFSNDPKKPWVHNWRLEVESAKREPIRHQVGS